MRVSPDGTKLSAAETLEGRDGNQRDHDRFEKLAKVNPTKFSKAKCKVLHLSGGYPQYQYRLGVCS